MTEKEKMLCGELYNAGDEELIRDRAIAKNMCFEYNKLTSSEIIKRMALIKNILKNRLERYDIKFILFNP